MKNSQNSFTLMLVILLLVLLTSYRKFNDKLKPPPQPVPAPIPVETWTFDKALASITSEELEKHVRYLASPELDGRKPNTPGYASALKYVKDNVAPLNLVEQQVNNYDKNGMIYIEGENPNEIIVVGAHLDHLGNGCLGADDDSSGSAAVIEIAKVLNRLTNAGKNKYKRGVLCQWYTAEESGLVGSRYYCNNPIFPLNGPDIKAVKFMIGLDMIGRKNSRAGNEEEFGVLDERVFEFGGSDHASFQSKGIKTKFYHTGLHRDYHTKGDTPDKVDYKGMEEITREAFTLAYQKATE